MASKKIYNPTRGVEKGISFTAHVFLPDRAFPDKVNTLYSVLDDMGVLYGCIKRTLFKDCIRTGQNTMTFKNDYLKRYGITARQFNAIRYDLDGIMKSAREVLEHHITELTDKIKSGNKWIRKRYSMIEDIRKDAGKTKIDKDRQIHDLRFAVHNKKRKLYALEQKLTYLLEDKSAGAVRICFGSKNLFHRQFNLHGNNYVSHEEWLLDWKKARGSSTFCLGSKDETGGNQTCTLLADGTLRLRIPDCLENKYGRHIVISGINYPYGQEQIDEALRMGRAVTHRFVRALKGWYLHTSVELRKQASVTFKPSELGCIGVDVNEKEIALSETDRYGNLVWSKTYLACVKDRSTSQTGATYGDICVQIVNHAMKTGKSIVHEILDFRKKKASLKEQNVTYARMLSGYAYSTFLTMLDRRAAKEGVMIYSINPAFTSVIGIMNYMSRCGITQHEAAAFVIARRAQQYSELPTPARAASPLPVRNRGEHVWKFWRRLKDSGACSRHHKLYVRRSLQDFSGCAEPQKISPSQSTAQSFRPPVPGYYDGDRTPIVIPIYKSSGLNKSGWESPTLIGSSTVRLPSMAKR